MSARALTVPSRRAGAGAIVLTPALARGAWRAVAADQVVGYVGSPDACPLTLLLRSRGYPAAHVGRSDWHPTGSTVVALRLPLPAWCRRFTARLGRTRYGRWGAAVTAATAIEVLDWVTHREAS